MVKRIFDVIFSFLGLILSLPLFLIIAILIKRESPGPVFFLQKRPGKEVELFALIKFRTMVEGAEKFGLDLDENNPRITRLGRFLRRWHVDEIPQLINVLLGQMSLVGPRPPMIPQIGEESEFERERFSVKPGITGWAQLHGGNSLSWSERVKYDVWYVRNRSLWLDFKIFLISLWKIIILGKGLYNKKSTNKKT